tara:strand:+ start:9508 stop:10326 length:819 start_codon:yes stop_codon:yes gene_type:complete
MVRERILITVKTYPILSTTYAELVCTAGFREDGRWVRIYPSPFRFLEKDRQYGKYHWIELELDKNPRDPRPESFRPRDIDTITVLEKVGTERAWAERRKLVLERNPVHTNLDTIIQASRKNEYSLAIFKPTEILDLVVKRDTRDWELTRKAAAEASLRQGSLFDDTDRSDFELVRKIPYKFCYHFTDDSGRDSTLMIEDWEIGALYWRYADNHGEEVAVAKVRQKYLDDFARTKDLYLFLGTTHQAHVRKLNNPYVIIGTFHPPYVVQPGLF